MESRVPAGSIQGYELTNWTAEGSWEEQDSDHFEVSMESQGEAALENDEERLDAGFELDSYQTQLEPDRFDVAGALVYPSFAGVSWRVELAQDCLIDEDGRGHNEGAAAISVARDGELMCEGAPDPTNPDLQVITGCESIVSAHIGRELCLTYDR